MCYNMITALEVDYENPWIYEGRPFTSDDIGDYYGSVSYTHLTLPTKA